MNGFFYSVVVLGFLCAFDARAAKFEVLELTKGLPRAEPDSALKENRCSNPELDEATRAWVGQKLELLRREEIALGIEAQRTAIKKVPVNFWIVVNANEKGMVSVDQLDVQLEILNKKFRKTGFRFEAGKASAVKYNKGYKKCLQFKRNGKVRGAYKKLARFVRNEFDVNTSNSINVFTCKPTGGTLGMSPFPWDFQEGDYRDGVVISWKSLPGGPLELYNAGLTLVHELGHYFGEFHTFEGGCDSPGDYISDTPYEESPAWEAVPENNCAIGRDTCPQPGTDPVRNPMDYSSDYCITKFTKGQHRDMKLLVKEFRPSLGGD